MANNYHNVYTKPGRIKTLHKELAGRGYSRPTSARTGPSALSRHATLNLAVVRYLANGYGSNNCQPGRSVRCDAFQLRARSAPVLGASNDLYTEPTRCWTHAPVAKLGRRLAGGQRTHTHSPARIGSIVPECRTGRALFSPRCVFKTRPGPRPRSAARGRPFFMPLSRLI